MKIKTSNWLPVILLAIIVTLPSIVLGQKKEKNGPPPWAPANGYRAQTRHVYFPDQNFYFDTKKNEYIFQDGKSWKNSAKLPEKYDKVDLKKARKEELDLDNDKPEKYNADHKNKYKTADKDKSKGEKDKEKDKSKEKNKKK